MTARSELEVTGILFNRPFAEILAELSETRLSGSLRLSDGSKKSIVYLRGGKVVFAVSNARSTRIFEMLLRRGRIKKEELVKIPNFSSDLDLTARLIRDGSLTREEVDQAFKDQIRAIVNDLLAWTSGDWTFSPLARVREGLRYEVDLSADLRNYSRCLPEEAILNRFRSLDETFRRSEVSEMGMDLTTHESFVLSRADEIALTAERLISLGAMPEVEVFHSLYTLWLTGLLIRDHWNPVFSEGFLKAIRSTKLELKQEARDASLPGDTRVSPVAKKPEAPAPEPVKPADVPMSTEDYLARVEKAETFYDILGIGPSTEQDELKKAYFSLARSFHPDRFHSQGGETFKRIQAAFTELAQAYETLKNPESREIYDYRIRKELAQRAEREAAGQTGQAYANSQQAAENFEQGYNLLMDNDAEAAVPFLARAAHFGPQNPRFRAYYGLALSFDDKQRHKAESEMQAAVKLEPTNSSFRLMLAEFFIKVNLLKRAEGELNRLLAVSPNNREARELLSGLKARV